MEDNQEEYALVHSFHIDQDELDHVTKVDAFVLGYELALIVNLVSQGDSFEISFHADNIERVEKVLVKWKVGYTIYFHDDWPTLVVNSEPMEAV